LDSVIGNTVYERTTAVSLHSGDYQMLTNQDVSAVVAILAATADITLVLTPDGVICDRVLAGPDIPERAFIGWPGKSWNETVTVESRVKVEQMLHEAGQGHPVRARQINHPIIGGNDLPIKYTAVRVGSYGHIVAAGRDLSAVAVLQQRLLAAEQSIEQEYLRLRHSETRFRVLLQSASDAIIIVDAKSGRVAESNPSAANLLNRPLRRIVGADIEDVFPDAQAAGVKRLLATLQSTGKADDLALRLDDENRQAILSATMFRQDSATYYLLRMVPHAVGTSAIVMPKAQSKVVKIISEMPDGFAVTDLDRRIMTANAAFLELAQLGSEEQARGNTIDQWLGRPGIDTSLLTSQLLDKGAIRNFRTIVRGQFGAVEDVEVSGVAVKDGDMPCMGFTLHRVSRHAVANAKPETSLLRSGDDFTRLVGKVPLKELIRESTDIIERLCIESALQLNSDNRAGAAEMLGISRQSLYVKLHRYGIDSPDVDVSN
jgi:transcriptional regulator PpsR